MIPFLTCNLQILDTAKCKWSFSCLIREVSDKTVITAGGSASTAVTRSFEQSRLGQPPLRLVCQAERQTDSEPYKATHPFGRLAAVRRRPSLERGSAPSAVSSAPSGVTKSPPPPHQPTSCPHPCLTTSLLCPAACNCSL